MSISRLTPAYETSLGKCYLGDALELLKKVKDNSISLVLTSPPFALRRQKAYGNVDAASYVDWICLLYTSDAADDIL
jgi:DNA modification methylase